jgi:hypothetical protein
LTQPGFEPTIYSTWDEHANHYIIDDVSLTNAKKCQYKNLTKHVDLVQSGHIHHHLIKWNVFSPWYGRQIVHLELCNYHSLTPIYSTWDEHANHYIIDDVSLTNAKKCQFA